MRKKVVKVVKHLKICERIREDTWWCTCGALGVVVVAASVLTGCATWFGPAEVRFHDGTVMTCPNGLAFDSIAVTCRGGDRGSDTRRRWGAVSGFSTK